MFLLFVVMCAVCCWLEYKLINPRPALRAWVETHSTGALIISLALSWSLGIMFGAAGLICMMAGLTSTAIMNSVWRNYDTVTVASQRGMTMMKLVWSIIIAPFRALGWVMARFEK